MQTHRLMKMMRSETHVPQTVKHTGLAAAIILCVCAASVARAQDKAILVLADAYASALKKFEARKGRSSLEGLLNKGEAVSEKLDDIESLSESEYARLEKKLRGFAVNREEILFIEPKAKFFARLATSHGTPADIAFFSLRRQIKPGDVWAAYIEQQTDVTGCIRYGTGSLTRLYGQILRFRKTYPKAYVRQINEESEAVLEEFTVGTCACGSREDVIREFQSFLKAFPADKKAPAVRKRLLKIRRSKEVRYNCQSG